MSTQRRTASFLIAAVLPLATACGGSDGPAGLGDDPPELSTDINVEQGNGQRAPPRVFLSDSVVGLVTDDQGTPVEGALVNFEVVGGDSIGVFEDRSLTTNENGRVFTRLQTGTVAWTKQLRRSPGDSTHTARLVASREGRRDVVAEMVFVTEPGPTAEYRIGWGRTIHQEVDDPELAPDSTLALRETVEEGLDEWGNPTARADVTEQPGDAVTWRWESRVANNAEAIGPEGPGWATAVVTPEELADRGYKAVTEQRNCPDSDGTWEETWYEVWLTIEIDSLKRASSMLPAVIPAGGTQAEDCSSQ